MNAVVEGLTVDAYWPAHGLVVELDSVGFHSSRASFEEDRRRTELLQNAGLEVRRFTRDRLVREPDAVLRSVELALGHSRHAPSRAA
jgi:very-short-patch-repair endonuclease